MNELRIIPYRNTYPPPFTNYQNAEIVFLGAGATLTGSANYQDTFFLGKGSTVSAKSLSGFIFAGNDTTFDKVSTFNDVITGNSSKISGSISANLTVSSTATIKSLNVYGNANLGYQPKIISDDGTKSTFLGCVFAGYYNNCDYATFDGPILLGRHTTLGENNNYNAPIIVGNECYYSITNTDSPLIAGVKFNFTPGKTTTLGPTTYIIGDMEQEIDNYDYITDRRCLILTAHKDKLYRAYWPNKLNYAAQFHGFIKCNDDFNLLDKDGNAIVENGKLLLEEKVKQLEQRIAELESKLS